MEYAYEGEELKGEGRPSVFTEAVVEGLRTGKADLDQDRLISIDDIYRYVYDRVRERTPSQTPSNKSDLEGPLYLATTGEAKRSMLERVVRAELDRAAQERGPEPAQVAPPPPPRSPARRRLVALAVAGVVAAGAAAAVVVLATDDGSRSGSGGHAVDPATWTPDWCAATDVPDPVEQLDAEQAVSCDVPNTLVPSDVHGAVATFARYEDAATARLALKDERAARAARDGESACDDGAERELTSIYEQGRAYCLPQPSSRTWVGFNRDGSSVTGSLTFDPPTTELSAVDALGEVG
jgi:hypothetical protein